MVKRIPHPTSEVEVRQAFQRFREDLDILTTGGAGEILVGVGGGSLPTWTTELTSLTLLTCDNITIDGATIVSDTGTIGFSDDNLTTTGIISGVNVTSGVDPGHSHSIYSLVDGTRPFTGPVGGVTPVSDSDLVTKEYVDQVITFVFDFYINDTASDIGGIYYKMLEEPTGEAASTFVVPGLDTGDDQALVNFATDANIPGTVVWKGGHYVTHIHAAVTAGTKPTKIYWTLVRRETDTTETVIGTSDVTDYLTATADPYYISLHLEDDVDVNVDDRLVVKFYANVEATGSNVDVTLYAEGDYASRLTVPVTTEIISNLYIRRDGSNNITGNISVDALVTIDGRDISADGATLDALVAISGQVAVDSGATPNYLGATAGVGALRTSTGISKTDGGDYITLTTNDGQIVHDNLSGFVADEHVAHSGVTLTAGSGLSGGGDISSSRTFDLDINSLAVAAIAPGDFVPFWDITATATNKKITFANFESTLNHDSLTGFVSNEHIDWTSASENLSTSGSGLFDILRVGSGSSNHKLWIDYSPADDSGEHGIAVNFNPSCTVASAPANYALYFAMYADTSAGISNTGTAAAIRGSCWCDSGLGAGATQRRLAGHWLDYGNVTGASGTITFLYGMNLQPWHQAGTVTTNYDIIIQAPVSGGSVTNDYCIYSLHDADSYLTGSLGLGQSSPAARFEVETSATEGQEAIIIDQNDSDQPFIDYQGTSAANASNSISTWTTGNSIQGFIRIEINGTVYWMPYYDAPTA